MKKNLFFAIVSLALLLSAGALMAQADIVPAGGTATGSGGSVTYTIGQTAVKQADGNGRYIIEGVQQPYEIQTVGVNNYPGITLDATVFPNPTRHAVRLRIANYAIPADGLTARLYDANGQMLRLFEVTSMESEIDLEQYPSAAYQLCVSDNKTLLKTFKIVKVKF